MQQDEGEIAAGKLTRLAKHRACAVNVFSERLGVYKPYAMLCYVQASFSMVFVVFYMVFDPVFEALPVKTPCLCNGFVGHALKPRTCAAG